MTRMRSKSAKEMACLLASPEVALVDGSIGDTSLFSSRFPTKKNKEKENEKKILRRPFTIYAPLYFFSKRTFLFNGVYFSEFLS